MPPEHLGDANCAGSAGGDRVLPKVTVAFAVKQNAAGDVRELYLRPPRPMERQA